MARSNCKRKAQHEISYLCSKESKIIDDEKKPIEFTDMCDNVIDIILCKLNLADLANISDTNNRLKNIAASVFSRRFGNCFISFDSLGAKRELSRQLEVIRCKNKPIVKIIDAKIWFKLLRNFGNLIKFISIQCEPVPQVKNETQIKMANVLKNLNEYVLKYCADSLERLQIKNLPFFTFNMPLEKVHEFIVHQDLCCNYEYENWNTEALNFLPNIRSLDLVCVPKSLEKNYPKLNRVVLLLEHDEDVHSFTSFLQFNRQITSLEVRIFIANYNDVIFSSIEKNLTQLKRLKLGDQFLGEVNRNADEPIPHYQFRTVETFETIARRSRLMDSALYTFEFNNLKKVISRTECPSEWRSFLLNYKTIKRFKISYYRPVGWLEYHASAVKELSESPELEQITVEHPGMKAHEVLKKIFGSEWKLIKVKKILRPFTERAFKSKFKRIFQKPNC